ncbi:MAG: ATP-grasp domain-containing protein [Gammaproteobacteria bacterium]|nr:ATP-grasp domain-containing protein [Gammaproteobacteria bacterium]
MSQAIAIVTHECGWHSERLRAVFTANGYAARTVSLTDCHMDIQHHQDDPGLRIPGFTGELPLGALVRGVPGGTLEEIVLYLDILHGLRELGVPVHNDARGIERTVDKGMTSFLLHRAGVPTPPTWVVRDPDRVRAIAQREQRAGHALVLKPLFGSQGNGIMRIAGPADVPEPERYQNVYYLQRYIASAGSGWHDWRVFVVAGRAIAAMRREGKTWINNVATGAACYAAVPDGAMCLLAEDAVRALDLSYAGVDLIRDRSGKLWVVEVNSVPAWKGLQGVCDVQIAEHVAGTLMSAIESLPTRAAV